MSTSTPSASQENISPGSQRSPQPVFVTTHWSVVLTAARSDTTRARTALENLCQTYWHPLYAYVRRRGYSTEDAQDLTQAFFARLLEHNAVASVAPEKGRFRSFLLGSLKHFLANEWDKARAQKRGGRKIIIPIDAATAETSCGFELADNVTAEKIFERRWALALLEHVLKKLREEHVRDAKEKLFDQLKPTLTEASRTVPYAEIASRLGATEGAIKVAVHRLRQRYRELLRAEIADTVSDPGEIEDEIRNLFAALS